MSRDIKPAKIIKQLPSLKSYKQQQSLATFGDLSPQEKQKFIMKHLSTNRKNFVASVPYGKVPEMDENRRILENEQGKRLVKKVIKKVIE